MIIYSGNYKYISRYNALNLPIYGLRKRLRKYFANKWYFSSILWMIIIFHISFQNSNRYEGTTVKSI